MLELGPRMVPAVVWTAIASLRVTSDVTGGARDTEHPCRVQAKLSPENVHGSRCLGRCRTQLLSFCQKDESALFRRARKSPRHESDLSLTPLRHPSLRP